MKNKLYIGILFFLFGILSSYSQSTYFYYNKEKFYIDIDSKYVSINTDILTTDYLNNSNYIGKSLVVEDNVRKYLTLTDPQLSSRLNLKSYYYELELNTNISNDKINYLGYQNTLSNISNITKVSPCYKTKDGKRLGLSNNFYVKLKNASDISNLYSYVKSNNLEVLGRDPYMPLWFVIRCTKQNSKNSLELANQFYETNMFASAEPAFIYHDLSASIDPLFNLQWGLKNTGQYGSTSTGIDIKAEQAWTLATGSNVKTAIFDQGFEMNHPDLLNNVFGTGYDANNGTSPSIVKGNHGTACAGIVGAVQNNSIGVSGIAPNTKLVSISINLQFSDTPIQLASGFSWARTNGVDIISNSWGGYAPSNIITDAITDAINLGRGGKGCVVVFAAGNENNTSIRYPGSALPNILVVGAMSPCGERKSPTSCDGETFWGGCYGSQLDVVAPGVKIATTDRQGSNGYTSNDYDETFNGTSSACPAVAGVCALILSANPCLSSKQVRDILEKTSQKVGGYSYTITAGRPNGTWNNEMGYGLVNAYAAVVMAQQMSSATLDLMVKDGTDDIGLQPNNITPYMWASTDIWVRNQADNIDEHQNPEYSPTVPNYAYVRVTNKSCVASTGSEQLKFYWAKAGTSLEWPDTWDGNHYFPSPNNTKKLGAPVGTVTIPILQAGQETILQIPFMVPNPADYSFAGSDQWHFCLLARIEALNDPSNETNGLYANVQNNNNIAWKNVTIVDLLANKTNGVIAVGNPFDEPRTFFLELIKEDLETGKAIYDEAEVSVKMDETLFKAWERGGKLAQELDATTDEKRKIVKGNNVIIDNIAFNANEMGTLNLNFNFLTKELTEKSKFVYHVVQRDALTGDIIGGETYVIKKQARPIFIADAGGTKDVDKNVPITISANQISEPAIYNWYDTDGNLVFTGKDLTIAIEVATKYKLEVIATIDGFKDYSEVEVNLKPSILNIIAPNPATENINISYKLNEVGSAYLMIIGSYGTTGASNNYILDINSSETNINLSNYTNGFYTVALVCNGQIVDAKTLIKQ